MSTRTRKVAIITGASRGIGAVVARRLAQDGFAVVINYASKADEAEALVAKLREGNCTAVAIQADVAKADDVRRLFEAAESALGKIDVVVNNAGILKTVPLADTTDDLFDQTFAVNARGTFNMLREAARRLNNAGRVINFSSTTLALNLPGYAVYNATKAAGVVSFLAGSDAGWINGQVLRANGGIA